MGFDGQSRRRISRSVLFTERLNRSRTPRVGGNRNVSKNPIYWAVATEDILRGQSGNVQLVESNGTAIIGETRTAHNDYEATVWQNCNCIVTVVDGEFRIIAADAATILLCATSGTVSSMTGSFSAGVIKDLDGFFGKAGITAQNTFSQDYESAELFLAFRNEEDGTWMADKVGGAGGNEVLIRFQLTSQLTLAGTSAPAVTVGQDLLPTVNAITVHDRVGEWAGQSGYQGIAFRGDNIGENYDIVFLEGRARWIRGTLVDALAPRSATMSIEYYWGSAPNGKNPGVTQVVFDRFEEFYWLKAGDKCLAVWDEQEAQYLVVWGEFPADVFAVDLVTDGGSAGVNGAITCSFTYTVRNAQTHDLLGNNVAPVRPRPAMTQMIAATTGHAHWEDGGGVAILVLDEAYETPTPRATISPVTSVSCNAVSGLDIYRRDVYLPVGSRVDAAYLQTTLLCTGGGDFAPGCGIVETTPGSGVYQVNPADLAGDGLKSGGYSVCDLAIDHDACTLEMTGTSPAKKLQVRLEAASTGGLLCSGGGVQVDRNAAATCVVNSVTGCSLEIDAVNELFKVTLNYTPFTFTKNAAGIVIGCAAGAPASLTACSIMTMECP